MAGHGKTARYRQTHLLMVSGCVLPDDNVPMKLKRKKNIAKSPYFVVNFIPASGNK
jgi:hypothetical protein